MQPAVDGQRQEEWHEALTCQSTQNLVCGFSLRSSYLRRSRQAPGEVERETSGGFDGGYQEGHQGGSWNRGSSGQPMAGGGHQSGTQSVGHEPSSGGSRITGSRKEGTGCEQSSGSFPREMSFSRLTTRATTTSWMDLDSRAILLTLSSFYSLHLCHTSLPQLL